MRFGPAFLAIVLLCTVSASASAYTLSQSDLSALDRLSSRFKISPEMVEKVEGLVAPYAMDDEIPGGFIFDGISVERFFVSYIFKSGDRVFEMVLLPLVVETNVQTTTDSFAVVIEGDAPTQSIDALVLALRNNDNGDFWPEVPVSQSNKTMQVAPGQQKISPVQLLGDVVFLMLFVFMVLAGGVFRKAFAARSLGWWLTLTGVIVVALGCRIWTMAPWSELSGVGQWSASDMLPHVSSAWFLNSMWRFAIVDQGLITVLNVIGGTATVGLLYLLASLSFPGSFAPAVAALGLAVLPAHVALSARVSTLIPFVMFAVAFFLTRLLYMRHRDLWIHLLNTVIFVVVLFARPEAMVLLAPLWLLAWWELPRGEWKRLHFLFPMVLQLGLFVIRGISLSSGPDYPDPFLGMDGLSVTALFTNLGAWIFDLSRVPFVLLALAGVGIAARGWKRPRIEWVGISVWFVLSWLIYYHVDLTEVAQGGRVSVVLFPTLLWWMGAGAGWLWHSELKHKRWIYALIVVWLLMAPWMHRLTVRKDYQTSYKVNFLTEA